MPFVVILVLGTAAFYGVRAFDEEQPVVARRCVNAEDFQNPPGYTNARLDRFFIKARKVVGNRWSHESQGCVRGERLDATFGVADLTSAEEEQLEARAPSWLRFDAFETEYSHAQLKDFCDRGSEAIQQRLHTWSGCTIFEVPGKLGIGVTEYSGHVERILDGVGVPRNAYFIRIRPRMEAF